MQKLILICVLVLFSVVSGLALYHHGYWGIIEPHFKTWGAGQVLFDLVIAVTILLVWMVRELRAAGKTAWPWVLFTLGTGSFGPLFYLLTQNNSKVSK
jgi:Terpene cyclase DEP1